MTVIYQVFLISAYPVIDTPAISIETPDNFNDTEASLICTFKPDNRTDVTYYVGWFANGQMVSNETILGATLKNSSSLSYFTLDSESRRSGVRNILLIII